jgi:hypothetical protein
MIITRTSSLAPHSITDRYSLSSILQESTSSARENENKMLMLTKKKPLGSIISSKRSSEERTMKNSTNVFAFKLDIFFLLLFMMIQN